MLRRPVESAVDFRHLRRRAATSAWGGPAGQEINNQPFAEIPWPMSGSQSTADLVGSMRQRRLRPSSVNWPSGSFRSTAVVRTTAPKCWRPAAIGWEPLFPVFPESRRWIDGGSAKVSYEGPISKGSPQPIEQERTLTREPLTRKRPLGYWKRRSAYRCGVGALAWEAVDVPARHLSLSPRFQGSGAGLIGR